MGTLRGFPYPPASALRRAKPASALSLEVAVLRPSGQRAPAGEARLRAVVGGRGVAPSGCPDPRSGPPLSFAPPSL